MDLWASAKIYRPALSSKRSNGFGDGGSGGRGGTNELITAKPGTPLPLTAEGFGLYDIYQTLNAGNFYDPGTSWVTGTVYQGNKLRQLPDKLPSEQYG